LSQLNRSKGFSLIEVLIAIVILSVSLLALAGLMVQTTQNNSFGNHMTEASIVAQDVFEKLRARPYNSMLAGVDSITGSTGQVYNRTWNILKVSTFAEAAITINWTDPTSHTISFRYNIMNLDL